MDNVKPAEVLENMINAATAKVALPTRDLLIRGFPFTGLALYLTLKPRAAVSATPVTEVAEPIILGKEFE